MVLTVLALVGRGAIAADAPGNTAKLTPTDLSTIRGANYRASGAADTTDYWRNYNAAETERDLTYADRLKLNQLRVFVTCAAWEADRPAFRKNLVDLARACNRHHIGLMIVVGDTQSLIAGDRTIDRDRLLGFVTDLVATVGEEPALAFWDASNEPDYNAPGAPRDQEAKRIEIARLIAGTLHELDKKTPVTIGVAYERTMEELADAVDVLSFHDYLATRAAIAARHCTREGVCRQDRQAGHEHRDGLHRAGQPLRRDARGTHEGACGLVYLGADDYQALGQRPRRVLRRWHGPRPVDPRGHVRPVPQPLGRRDSGERQPGGLGQHRRTGRPGVARRPFGRLEGRTRCGGKARQPARGGPIDRDARAAHPHDRPAAEGGARPGGLARADLEVHRPVAPV